MSMMYCNHITAALRLRGLFVKYSCNCHQNPTSSHALSPAAAAAAVFVCARWKYAGPQALMR